MPFTADSRNHRRMRRMGTFAVSCQYFGTMVLVRQFSDFADCPVQFHDSCQSKRRSDAAPP